MQPKILSKWSLIVFCVVVILVVAVVITFLIAVFSNQDSYAKPASSIDSQTQQDLTVGLPIRFMIPKINVDAPLEYVGLTPQGAMAVPAGPTDVAWFNLGPRPGESGSAVIAGHEGWKDGIAAVFDNLHQLQKGDKVYTKDERGVISTFIVREIRTYDQNGDTSDIFNSSDEKAHLNLITCEGIWNAAKQSYSDRLVVFADKE